MLLVIKIILMVFSSNVLSQGFRGKSFPEPKIEYAPKSYVCYRTLSPIVMDGKLDDPSWLLTDWTESFVDIEGRLKPKPFYDTKVKMLWDERYFYFAAKLEDPHIWATLKMRDTVIFKNNNFEIFLDPDGDTHNYMELEVNAFATEWDLLLLAPYHDKKNVAIDSWDISGLITKVSIDGTINNAADRDNEWSVEIAIPWEAIQDYTPNLLPVDGEHWKVNFARVQWDIDIINNKYIKTKTPEFNWVWSPHGLVYMHMPDLWGLVQFTNEEIGGNKIEFIDTGIDKVKWALRKVYYRQRNYYHRKERYTASIKELNLLEKPSEGVPWPPKITLNTSGWQASLEWNNITVIIRTDGKVWVI